MSQHPDEEPSHDTQQRLQLFLDSRTPSIAPSWPATEPCKRKWSHNHSYLAPPPPCHLRPWTDRRCFNPRPPRGGRFRWPTGA
jgi:hypothetical protein